MDKIKKVSSYLTIVFKFIFFIIPLSSVLQWWFLNWNFYRENIFPALELSRIINPNHLHLPNEYSLLSIAIGSLGSLIGVFPIVIIFKILIKLFKNYKQFIIFSYENSQKYKQIGWLLIWDALLAKPIGGMLITLGGSLSNPPGHRSIALTVGIPHLESLFFGIIIIFISWIMIEGSRLQEEQKFTV